MKLCRGLVLAAVGLAASSAASQECTQYVYNLESTPPSGDVEIPLDNAVVGASCTTGRVSMSATGALLTCPDGTWADPLGAANAQIAAANAKIATLEALVADENGLGGIANAIEPTSRGLYIKGDTYTSGSAQSAGNLIPGAKVTWDWIKGDWAERSISVCPKRYHMCGLLEALSHVYRGTYSTMHHGKSIAMWTAGSLNRPGDSGNIRSMTATWWDGVGTDLTCDGASRQWALVGYGHGTEDMDAPHGQFGGLGYYHAPGCHGSSSAFNVACCSDQAIIYTHPIQAAASTCNVYGKDALTPGKSCLDIFNKCKKNANGKYFIQPDGEDATEVYCDFVTQGGGWTLVAGLDKDTPNSWHIYDYETEGSNIAELANAGGTTGTSFSARGTLSSSFINSIMRDAANSCEYMVVIKKGTFVMSMNRVASHDYFRGIYDTTYTQTQLTAAWHATDQYAPALALELAGTDDTMHLRGDDCRAAGAACHYIPDDVSGGWQWAHRENAVPAAGAGDSVAWSSQIWVR